MKDLSSQPKINLNNGVEMPQIGLGTFLIPKEELDRTIGEAYDLGYRQFDTAWRYYNEKEIARSIKSHGIDRDNIFITTKVNIDALYLGRYHGGKLRPLNIRIRSIKKAVELSFRNLGFDVIDLFLVHTPWEVYPEMYEVLTEFYHKGYIKAIGVSSFLPPMIESLKSVSDVIPAVNQFEISPFNTQKQLISWCKSHNIAVEAMSVFSHFRSNTPRKEIIENEEIQKIGSKYGKSVVQVILRWLIQQNIIIIPKTWDHNHLKENIEILDFQLSKDDMDSIDQLDKGKFLNYNPYPLMKNVPEPYKNWSGFNA